MLHLTDISKSFGTQTVLDQASLHVKPGMRVGLVGPNGAGKTTLLRLIVGEMSLDGGEMISLGIRGRTPSTAAAPMGRWRSWRRPPGPT